MRFSPDASLGAGWFRSACGRYRVARFESRVGDTYVAWLWDWELPELLGQARGTRAIAALCELNERYGGAP